MNHLLKSSTKVVNLILEGKDMEEESVIISS